MSTSAGKRKVNAKITTDAGVENERSSRKMKFPARIEGILGKLPVAERLELSSFLGGGGRLGAGRREKVCIIGSGNWGSVIAKIVAENVVNGEHSSLFERDVPMWVFEEYVNGEKLSEIVNAKHENIKYLPGIKLPDNVFAVSDVGEAARDATILVFVLPHQVLPTCYVHATARQKFLGTEQVGLNALLYASYSSFSLPSSLVSEKTCARCRCPCQARQHQKTCFAK
jgi:hypothetical protein